MLRIGGRAQWTSLAGRRSEFDHRAVYDRRALPKTASQQQAGSSP